MNDAGSSLAAGQLSSDVLNATSPTAYGTSGRFERPKTLSLSCVAIPASIED
jgi:hypothetical protein